MISGAFKLACRIFENAERRVTISHRIQHPPIGELLRESRRWFALLEDDDERYARSLKRKVWYLRTTAVLSLVPFDHPDLKLAPQLENTIAEARDIPFLSDPMERLTRIVQYIIDHPENPKRERVFQVMHDSAREKLSVAIIAALTRGAVPGWSANLAQELIGLNRRAALITSERQLQTETFDEILLVGGGRLSSLAVPIHHGFFAWRLHIVTYEREPVHLPRILNLPLALPSHSLPEARIESAAGDAEDAGVDDWFGSEFWKAARDMATYGSAHPSEPVDRQFLVRGRLVILAENRSVYLRDEAKVMEISDLLEGRVSLSDVGRRFPRKRADELSQGDLIVIRTSGSGDYLIDVADQLLRADGKQSLREEALKWKALLRAALLIRGSEEIAGLLAKKGHVLSGHRYIWMWTTDLVIRPRSQSLFYELMAILDDLGLVLDETSAVELAENRWRQMDEILRYHRIAGQRIRRALLARLRTLIGEGVRVHDFYRFTLPDVSAGEMSVCRVVAVDPESVEVPYHQVGVIRERGVLAPWLE